MKQSVLIVEGPHDAAFFGRLIQRKGYSIIKNKEQIPQNWRPYFPNKPISVKKDSEQNNDTPEKINRINSFPDIFISNRGDLFIIIVTHGDGNIIYEFDICVEYIGRRNLNSIGIVIDADKKIPAMDRFELYRKKLEDLNSDWSNENVPDYPLPLPQRIGEVFAGPPKIGIFVLPNNADPGALETVLLECVQSNAPHLHDCAANTVKHVADNHLNSAELEEFRKPMGREKATAGIIANLLYPGASLASSLQSDIWLRGDALNHPAVQQADAFLQALL
jgi:hypothetical protein